MKIQRNVILTNEEIQKLLTKFVEKKTASKVTTAIYNAERAIWEFQLEDQDVTDDSSKGA